MNEEEARKAFFEIHYGTDDGRDGRIGFFAGGRDGLGMKTVSYLAEGDSFGRNLERLKFHPRTPYYVTPNAFSKNDRCSERLFRLKNVVVDADAHGREGRERIDAALDVLEAVASDGAFEDYGIPLPNTIVRTGRGAQLWFRLEDCSAALKWMYDAVARFLSERVGEILKGYPALSGVFEIDPAASGCAAGIARLPGSWNAKAGRKGSFRVLHDVRQALPDLYEDAKAAAREKGAAGRTSFGTWKSRSDVLADRRVEAMRRLIEFRRRNGVPCEGSRDLILLAAYCAMANSSMTDAEADERTSELNASFENPLPEKEWRRFLSTARRKKYRFTTKRIIELLSLTEEEQEAIGLKAAARRTSGSRKPPEERDGEIRRLCEAGNSKKEIAAALSCSEQTVARRMKAMGLKTEREKRAEAALAWAVLGGTAAEIAEKFGYGRSRAAEIAAKARGIAERERFRRLRREKYAQAARTEKESRPTPAGAGFSGAVREIPAALRIIGSLWRRERERPRSGDSETRKPKRGSAPPLRDGGTGFGCPSISSSGSDGKDIL